MGLALVSRAELEKCGECKGLGVDLGVDGQGGRALECNDLCSSCVNRLDEGLGESNLFELGDEKYEEIERQVLPTSPWLQRHGIISDAEKTAAAKEAAAKEAEMAAERGVIGHGRFFPSGRVVDPSRRRS